MKIAMLPASNRGSGQSLNFPDVCKTPAPPAPFVPVPYPDIGMNMQAAPFSPFVQVGFVPATNMGSLKTMTSGDEAGAMGGLMSSTIKAPGKTTVGNPLVLVTGLPAECLANPTSGNMMNAPIGVQMLPSVINVLYTYRGGDVGAIDAAGMRELSDVARGEGEAARAAEVVSRWLAPGIAYLRVGLFSAQTDRDVFNVLRRLGEGDLRGVVVDLRSNPGGDTHAAVRFAEAWLPRGTVLLRERDGDGDEEEIIARGEPSYPWPLCLLLDGASASAAELVAASLQHHGRATVIGRQSYGKATGQRALSWPDGSLRYTTVAEYRLPDGGRIDGRGVTPDQVVEVAHGHECVLAAIRVLEARLCESGAARLGKFA